MLPLIKDDLERSVAETTVHGASGRFVPRCHSGYGFREMLSAGRLGLVYMKAHEKNYHSVLSKGMETM